MLIINKQILIYLLFEYHNFQIQQMKFLIAYKDRKIQSIINDNNSVIQLKKQLQKQTNIPTVQQQLSFKSGQKKVILSDDQQPLKLTGIAEGCQLRLKDLGKQIRWDYVFYIQYLGPILIFPILYLLGDKPNYTSTQSCALLMAVLHYLKRQYQTAYVHVFSRYSMPFKRVFINCIHYWIFFALANGIQLYIFPNGHEYNDYVVMGIVLMWVIVEFCNYKCHGVLASFRRVKEKAGEYENASKKRGIPFGWGFGYVSCANYFWQALGWILFSILARTWTAYLFTALSIYQMTEWALKKHSAYKKQFTDKYPKSRKAIFPFII